MFEPTFEQFADNACYLIGELLTKFVEEVDTLSPTDTEKVQLATTLMNNLRAACSETIKILDVVENDLAPFKEPVPTVVGGDFEADVLRDIAQIDNPRHRPVSHTEAKAWSKDWIAQQDWA